MTSWIAHTMAADFKKGGRFIIAETMRGPWERPAYKVGDEFTIAPTNVPHDIGEIVEIVIGGFFVEVGDLTLRMTPTPPNYPPHHMSSGGPYDDYIGQPV